MVTEGQRVWRAARGGGASRRSALGAGVGTAGGAAWLAAARAVNEVKERGDPILKG
jgi:hypothetical protein